MKFFIIAAFVAIAAGETFNPLVDRYHAKEFSSFTKKFGKSYATTEESQFRLDVFKANLKKMNAHNARRDVSWKMGINKFSDMTDAEFEATMMGGYKATPTPTYPATLRSSKDINIKDLPESVNWCDKGACSPVKDQGSCGSCWAFATTAAIESHIQISTGDLPLLSTQQVTSCTPNPLKCGGTGGCMGSIPQLGFTYIQLFGHISEEDYPYISGSTMDTEDCLYMPDQAVAGLSGYNILEPNSLEAVMDFVANQGPLAIAAYASPWGRYSSGVFDGCPYDGDIALNHAIVLVGYGTDAAEGDYWLVRNSWGTGWGEDGFIRLKRESTAVCGVNSSPMDGTACVGGPGNDQQTVCGMCGMLFDTSYPLGAHMHSKK